MAEAHRALAAGDPRSTAWATGFADGVEYLMAQLIDADLIKVEV